MATAAGAVRRRPRLDVAVRAADLRFVDRPILVGHYDRDVIAGAEALIDDELLAGALRERHELGLYAGQRGTASVVLRIAGGQARRWEHLRGAVVTGLGGFDQMLSSTDLVDAVRTGVLRYLLQVIDVLGEQDAEVPLAALLVGYNSSAHLTVEASVEALVRGTLEANARLARTMRWDVRVGSLEIVELYLDTAITAAYGLRRLAPRLQAVAREHGWRLTCHPELLQGEGMRQRLMDGRDRGHWPRMIVTSGAADDLRFVYVGRRARAEAVLQQWQSGLVESIIRQNIRSSRWNEDLGRMLFQLLVPQDMKDAARQLDRVVLVVDERSASLPWELLHGDEPGGPDGAAVRPPLALRTALVRQLATTDWRRVVKPCTHRRALVIGNPSVDGFGEAFRPPGGQPLPAPPALPGAEAEAHAVASLLAELGYEVVREIGADRRAADLLAALYRRPWRFLHVCAHGVFALRHADGRERSGVVLSDGLLLTAAEIAAMETVPDLVVLNCCHLGRVDAPKSDGNRLAASLARELIGIGVRCVVVAGWAVDDACAKAFSEALYRALLVERDLFGDAVLKARQAAWRTNPEDITWGAFQAYGDPAWTTEPRVDRAAAQRDAPYVSLEELLDELARLRTNAARLGNEAVGRGQRARLAARLRRTLRRRCAPPWLTQPQVLSSLGAAWLSLGELAEARRAWLLAVQAEDTTGRVPIRDLERLIEVEARLGEETGGEAGLALLETAMQRLDRLERALGSPEAPGAARLLLRAGLVQAQSTLLASRAAPADPMAA